MQIIKNKALLLKLRNPGKITTVIPHSQELDGNTVLVKWGLDEARVLTNIGIRNVLSPILGHYTWPGQYKPFEHQKVTASFLTLRQKAFCFSEMGCGKTGSVIWGADYLMNMGVVKRVLIVCPLSIMDSAWRADLFKLAMHRKVDIAFGSAAQRREVINGDAEFVIINYDGVPVVLPELRAAGFDLVVADECTNLKNVKTNRWKAFNSLITPTTWLWMLTGTPAAQSPLDAYGLAKLVNPKAIPKFAGSFRDMVMVQVSNFRWVPKVNAAKIIHQVLQPAIRYTKEECLDLPEMLYVKRDVELTAQQRKYYDIFKKEMVLALAGEQVTAANAAILLNKLLQISCGATYTDERETIEFDISNRYNVLQEVIEESSQKVLIFVPFRNAITLLHQKLTADGVTCEIINGDVTAANRTKIFDQFQTKPDPKVLIIQPQAAAHGVTLTAANTVVWWGPVPSLETYAQANARVHRVGQRHPCTVVQLQGSAVERHVYRMLDDRIDAHTKIIDLYKQIVE